MGDDRALLTRLPYDGLQSNRLDLPSEEALERGLVLNTLLGGLKQ